MVLRYSSHWSRVHPEARSGSTDADSESSPSTWDKEYMEAGGGCSELSEKPSMSVWMSRLFAPVPDRGGLHRK